MPYGPLGSNPARSVVTAGSVQISNALPHPVGVLESNHPQPCGGAHRFLRAGTASNVPRAASRLGSRLGLVWLPAVMYGGGRTERLVLTGRAWVARGLVTSVCAGLGPCGWESCRCRSCLRTVSPSGRHSSRSRLPESCSCCFSSPGRLTPPRETTIPGHSLRSRPRPRRSPIPRHRIPRP